MIRAARTVLELKIRERRQTLEEFAEFAEVFAREHREPGTLSLRHLQRLVAGRRSDGRPLGPVRPVTARLLERIFGLSIDELLRQPEPTLPGQFDAGRRVSADDRSGGAPDRRVQVGPADDLVSACEWLDQRCGLLPGASLRNVRERLAEVDVSELLDRHTRRSEVGRRQLVRSLFEYYGQRAGDYFPYRASWGNVAVETSIITCSDWLALSCPLGVDYDQLSLSDIELSASVADIDETRAVERLAEAGALGVRMANSPLYRLRSVDARADVLTGSVGLVPFVEYALTMDLLENELTDAVMRGGGTRRGRLPLRDKYLPSMQSVLDIQHRICVGGVVALCAIARPADPYRGAADYALLVQERSGYVLNASRRLSVIPKGFHQPLKDIRADSRIGATLRREMEEELFGRGEVDSTRGSSRVAAPMHRQRLSEPMRWLMDGSSRLRMECTGFGLNLVSGNYEFAGLVVIDDDEFWTRFGGQVEANWEAAGLRLYSSLDEELLGALVMDEAWSSEGLFALFQGLGRLTELGGERVNLPAVRRCSAACS